MPTYTASEAAAKLNVQPKLLRKLLREDRTLKAPGSGASWSFTDEHLPLLEAIVTAHADRPKGSKTARTTPILDDAGLPAAVCRSNSRSDRAAVRALSAARVDRLEAALRAAGLHISQLRDRDWRTQDQDAELAAAV
jgi:hypothetical protein